LVVTVVTAVLWIHSADSIIIWSEVGEVDEEAETEEAEEILDNTVDDDDGVIRVLEKGYAVVVVVVVVGYRWSGTVVVYADTNTEKAPRSWLEWCSSSCSTRTNITESTTHRMMSNCRSSGRRCSCSDNRIIFFNEEE
jgi:hypothetical protein